MRGAGRRAILGGLLLAPLAGRGAVAQDAPVSAFLAVLKQSMKAPAFAARVAALGPAIDKTFDLEAILAASVGPRLAGFSGEQKTALSAAFREFTVATWAANFNADDGTRFEVLAERRSVGSDVVVATRIVPPSGEATRLDYVMRQGAQGWRAVDMLVDGSISRVAVQRSDFRTLLKDGNPAPLIAMLRDKAAELARG